MKRNEEHAFIKIEKDIKDGNIPSLVLLYGKEDYLVDFYGNRLSKMYVNPAAEALDLMVIDRNYMTTSQIIDNFETMPLLSERKVVYIPRFYDAKAKLPKSFSDEPKAIDRLAEYITNLPDKPGELNRLMVITFSKPGDDIAGKALKASPLYKAIKKVGAIYEFDSLDYGQLRGFIEKRFRVAAKSARRDIINLIIEECGYENKNIDYGL
ncbi:MAG: hypothetical protein Q4B78_00195, partial [Bacillota bacterium]|nr:hypothetical protein [Bacillota bacterium]